MPDLGKAYVQIVPSAEGIKGSIQKVLEPEAASAGKSAGTIAGGGFSDLLKKTLAGAGITAIAATIGKAIGETVKESVTKYAAFEQLTGGVETLFQDSADMVKQYADNAYRTAGLSANQYMETVTGFSASLLQSLGGDTKAAAQLADIAITDMADNANKMGSDMASIQTAYQGFAKQNYTMLDNLKLGYGGTKTEMERLLQDAERIKASQGEVATYSIDSYADIVEAIHVVQTEMRISGLTAEEAAEAVRSGAMTEEEAFAAMGTTAKEASSTIEGSLNSAKAAWDNLLIGMADDNADMDKLAKNFADSLATAGENVLPAAERAVFGIAETIDELAPHVAERLPGFVEEVLPSLVAATAQIAASVQSNIGPLAEAIGKGLWEGVKRSYEEYGSELFMDTSGIGLLVRVAEALGEKLGILDTGVQTTADGFGVLAEGTFAASDAANELTGAITEEDQAARSAADGANEETRALAEIGLAAYDAMERGGDLRGAYEALSGQLETLDGDLDQGTRDLVEQSLALLRVNATANETVDAFADLGINVGKDLEDIVEHLESTGQSADEFASGVASMRDSVVNNFKKIVDENSITADQMGEALSANLETMKGWKSNLEELWSQAYAEQDENVMNYLSHLTELGPDYAVAVADFANGGYEKLKSQAEDFAEVGQISMDFYMEAQQAEQVNAETTAERIAESAEAAMEGVDFRPAGTAAAQGMAQGMRNNAGVVISAGSYLGQIALRAAKQSIDAHSPSRRFRDEVGKMITEGVAVGMVSDEALRSLKEASNELTGETVKDLQTMVRAWDDVYDSYFEGLEHQSFFAELSGGTDKIIANYREAQQLLHEQKLHYLDLGVDANDSAIRKMEEQWWKYEEAVAKTVKSASESIVSGLEHSIFLMEKNGKSAGEVIAAYREIQAEAHKAADKLRELGYKESDAQIQAWQKTWWSAEDAINGLIEDAVREATDAAKTAASALEREYQSAFNTIMSKQEAMQNKLSGYGELFIHNSNYTGPNSVVWLKDIGSQVTELEKYQKTLNELKNRSVDSDLMEEILGLGVDDANAYGAQLLKLSDQQWAQYMSSYEKKRELAESIAEDWYKDDLVKLDVDYIDKAMKALGQVLESYTETLPTDQALNVAIIEKIGDGVGGVLGELLQPIVGNLAGLRAEDAQYSAAMKMAAWDDVSVEQPGNAPDGEFITLAEAMLGYLTEMSERMDDEDRQQSDVYLDGYKVGEIMLPHIRRASAANPEVRDD